MRSTMNILFSLILMAISATASAAHKDLTKAFSLLRVPSDGGYLDVIFSKKMKIVRDKADPDSGFYLIFSADPRHSSKDIYHGEALTVRVTDASGTVKILQHWKKVSIKAERVFDLYSNKYTYELHIPLDGYLGGIEYQGEKIGSFWISDEERPSMVTEFYDYAKDKSRLKNPSSFSGSLELMNPRGNILKELEVEIEKHYGHSHGEEKEVIMCSEVF